MSFLYQMLPCFSRQLEIHGFTSSSRYENGNVKFNVLVIVYEPMSVHPRKHSRAGLNSFPKPHTLCVCALVFSPAISGVPAAANQHCSSRTRASPQLFVHNPCSQRFKAITSYRTLP